MNSSIPLKPANQRVGQVTGGYRNKDNWRWRERFKARGNDLSTVCWRGERVVMGH